MSEIMLRLSAFGASLIGWVGSMTAWTALILVGAVLADLVFARRVRASCRILLYGAVALRTAFPVDWSSPFGVLAGSPVAATVADHESAFRLTTMHPSAGSALPWMALLGMGYFLVAGALL